MLCQQARKKRNVPKTTSPMRMYSMGVSDKSFIIYFFLMITAARTVQFEYYGVYVNHRYTAFALKFVYKVTKA